MGDIDRGQLITPKTEGREDMNETVHETTAATACTTLREEDIDRSIVIFVQQQEQQQQTELFVPFLTAADNSASQQLVTLVPQVCHAVLLKISQCRITI